MPGGGWHHHAHAVTSLHLQQIQLTLVQPRLSVQTTASTGVSSTAGSDTSTGACAGVRAAAAGDGAAPAHRALVSGHGVLGGLRGATLDLRVRHIRDL